MIMLGNVPEPNYQVKNIKTNSICSSNERHK